AHDLASQFRWKARSTPLGFIISRGVAATPDELRRRLTGRTDAAGNVSLKDLTSADTGGITVTAAAFGSQTATLDVYTQKDHVAGFPPTFTLRPVGRLAVRLTAPDAAAVKGWALRVYSHDDRRPDTFVARGEATATPDDAGRVEVPVLASGSLS